jgi:hypothetical protein
LHAVIKTRDRFNQSFVIPKAGWHLGYQGGPQVIHYKYFSAVEPFDKSMVPSYDTFIEVFNERAVDGGYFIYCDNLNKRDLRLEKVTLSELPKSLTMHSYNSNSQAAQDVFALTVNEFKTDGFFVDLGSNEPKTWNNSHLLESQYNWRGILVDYDEYLVNKCARERSSVCLRADLMSKSVTDILDEQNAPEIIDYLSLDLDFGATLAALQSIDFNKYKFRCVTFEHDAYLKGEEIREPSRKIFEEAGYTLLCENVRYGDWAFEDWYVKKELVDFDAVSKMSCQNKEGKDIINLWTNSQNSSKP